MKIATIVLGILTLALGVYCLITPIGTYSTIGWLIGLVMLIEGIASVATWNNRRKYGFADGWTLAGAIVSVILGCFLLFSFIAQWAVDLFIAYVIAAWFVIGGITRIIAAFKLREFNKQASYEVEGSNWVLLLIMGVLVTVFGVLCIFEPVTIMVGIGIMIGVAIIVLGIDLIVRGIRMPS